MECFNIWIFFLFCIVVVGLHKNYFCYHILWLHTEFMFMLEPSTFFGIATLCVCSLSLNFTIKVKNGKLFYSSALPFPFILKPKYQCSHVYSFHFIRFLFFSINTCIWLETDENGRDTQEKKTQTAYLMWTRKCFITKT